MLIQTQRCGSFQAWLVLTKASIGSALRDEHPHSQVQYNLPPRISFSVVVPEVQGVFLQLLMETPSFGNRATRLRLGNCACHPSRP